MKLFTSRRAVIQTAPAHEKKKQKTYRELLQLDRPRKKPKPPSDDEDEDFLQKLLREQALPKSASRPKAKESQIKEHKERRESTTNVQLQSVPETTPQHQRQQQNQENTSSQTSQDESSNDPLQLKDSQDVSKTSQIQQSNSTIKQTNNQNIESKVVQTIPSKPLKRSSTTSFLRVRNNNITRKIQQRAYKTPTYKRKQQSQPLSNIYIQENDGAKDYKVIIQTFRPSFSSLSRRPGRKLADWLKGTDFVMQSALDTQMRPSTVPFPPSHRCKLQEKKPFKDRVRLFRNPEQEQLFIRSLHTAK